jgi:HemY protein
MAYAERGELTHPRFERGERGVSDLPELPGAYADSTPFISAAESGVPAPIVDDSDFGDDLDPAAAAPDPPQRPRRAFGGGRGKGR